MNKDTITTFSNEELVSKLQALCAREREAVAEVILHLIEFDSRKLYLKLGFSSLYAYCTKALKYSEGAAMRRINAARCIRDHAKLYDFYVEGRLSLAVIALLHGRINAGNEERLIASVMDKSRSEAEVELNKNDKPAPVREVIRPLRAPVNREPAAPLFHGNENRRHGGGEVKSPDIQEPVPEEQRFEIRFSVSTRFMDKLRKVQARRADGHKLEGVFEKLLDNYLEAESPKRNRSASKKRSRHIFKAVKSEVFDRDGHRCSFVSANGRRCDAIKALQIDHRFPYARGGGNRPENLRLLCPAHNRLEARRAFPEFKLESCQS